MDGLWGYAAAVAGAGGTLMLAMAYQEQLLRETLLKVEAMDPAAVAGALALAEDGILEYIAVSGTIACDQPIITQHADPHVPCVMLDTEVLEHRAKWGKSNGWRTEVTRKSQTFRDCPFYVIGSSEGALGVQNGTVDETAPPSASTGVHIPDASTSADRGGKPLVKVFDRFSPMSSLSFQSTGGYLAGDYIMGYQTVETACPVGATVTVVGKAMMKQGVPSLVPPTDGNRFYMTYSNLSTLIQDASTTEQRLRYLGIGLLTVAAACGATWAVYYIAHRRRERLAEAHLRRHAGASRPSATDAVARSGSQDSSRSGEDCVVCLGEARECMFLDCGHYACCRSCADILVDCPVCRARIRRVVRVYQA